MFLKFLCASFLIVSVNTLNAQGLVNHSLTDSNCVLYVSGRVTKSEYCSSDSLKLAFEISFRNQCSKALIIDRTPKNFSKYQFFQKLPVNDKLKSARVVSPFPAFGKENEKVNIPIFSNFIVLNSGETYVEKVVDDIVLLEEEDAAQESDGELGPGDYEMVGTVPMWNYSSGLIDDFRDRVASYGILWTDSVRTTPIAFKVLPYSKRISATCRQ